MAIRKSIGDITQSDLEGLIASEVVEDQTTEYKRDLNIAGEPARREFFRDVSSFANAVGGDIIFGIQAADGKPKGLTPLNNLDVDATPLQLRDLCLAHIDPPVRGIAFQVIPLSLKRQKGHVLLVRVPQSWNRPHMVKYDDNRFYRRHGAGKRQMNTSELREAFALSASTSERMKAHRFERLSLIRQHQTPVTLPPSNAFIVVHLFPLASFEQRVSLDMKDIYKRSDLLTPMAAEHYPGWGRHYNFDGVVASVAAQSARIGSYLQVFRNGCLEAVETELLKPLDGQRKTIIPLYELRVGEAVEIYFELLKSLGFEPPIFLMLSLLGVNGYEMFRRPGVLHRPMTEQSIRHDDLIMPEVQIDEYAESYFPFLKQSFDVVWQACGWEGDPNYDKNGVWNYQFQ